MVKKCDGDPCFGGSARGGRIECTKCRKQFHLKCVSLTGNQFKAVRECPGALWFCVVCRNSDVTADNRPDDSAAAYDVILQRITSILKLVGAQIDVSRSICRAIGSSFTRPNCQNPRSAQSDSRNFHDELDRMQFEFTEVFNSFINNDQPSAAIGTNKRDRTSSSTSSFPRNDKIMRVDVSVGTSDYTDIIVPLLADADEFNAPPTNQTFVESSVQPKQIITTHTLNSATITNQTTATAAIAAAVAITDSASVQNEYFASSTANAAVVAPAIYDRTTAAAAAANLSTINNLAAQNTPIATTSYNQATRQATSTELMIRTSTQGIQYTTTIASNHALPLPHQAPSTLMNMPVVNISSIGQAPPLPQRAISTPYTR